MIKYLTEYECCRMSTLMMNLQKSLYLLCGWEMTMKGKWCAFVDRTCVIFVL